MLNLNGLLRSTGKPMRIVLVQFLTMGYVATTSASVSLERTIQLGQSQEHISAMLQGNEGRLLVLSDEAVLSEYKGKAATTHKLVSLKVFESEESYGLTRYDENSFLISSAEDNAIALVDSHSKLIQKYGEDGSGEGQLSSPHGIDWSHNGRLYVADKGNNRISVFGQDGVYIRSIGVHGLSGDQRLDEPVQVFVDLKEQVYVFEKRNNGVVSIFNYDGKLISRLTHKDFDRLANNETEIVTITVDDKGLLYAADKKNGRIYQLDWQLKKLISSFGSKGEQRGQFENVSSMVTLPGNKLAVADSDNRKIEIYRLQKNSYKKQKKFFLPTVGYERSINLKCSLAYRLQGGDVLCLDNDNNRVITYKSSGKKVTEFQGKFSDLKSASIDDQDVVILDGDKIKFYRLDGRMRFEVGSSGDEEGKLDSPEGVYLARDRVYVADTGNDRIQIFSRDGIYLDKIARPKNAEQSLFGAPAAVAVDNSDNLFVLDSEYKQVLVFGPNHNLLYRIGGKEDDVSAYTKLYDIAVDNDENLYVLGGIEGNNTMVQVFNGPTKIISFGAQMEGRVGLEEPANISIPIARKTIVSIYDRELKTVKNYKFKQLPPKPGGLEVRGSIGKVELSWDKVPGSFTSRYKVYGAREKAGEYKFLTDVSGLTANLENKTSFAPRFYRVSAISGFSVEGELSNSREDIFLRAHELYKTGKYKQAQKILADAYNRDKSHGDVIKYLGLISLELNDVDAAVAYFNELSQIKSFEIEGANLQIRALVENGEFVSAKAVIDRLIADEMASTETIIYCGELSLNLGDVIGAIDCLEEAIARDKNSIRAHFLMGKAYIKLGIQEKGLAEFTAAETIAPTNSGVWYQSGLAYQSLTMHTEAVERFNKSLKLKPGDESVQLALARSYLEIPDYDNARNIAIKLAGNHDTEADGQYLLGMTAYATGDFTQALLSLSKSTRADKTNATAWLALADTYVQLKQQDKVETVLQSAVDGDDKSFEAAYRLGLLQYDNGEYRKAAVHLYDATVLQPDHFDAQLKLTESLLAAGAYNKAASTAANAARLQDKNLELLTLQAEIFNKQGKNGKAIDYLKQAIALDKNSAELHTRLGAVYVENGVYDAASSALDKAILLDKTSATPHVLLASMYMSRRMYDRAIKSLDKAVSLDPSEDNKLALDTAYAEQKRAIEFEKNAPKVIINNLKLEHVFSATYKQYVDKPVGQVTIKNGSAKDYANLKLRFSIRDYMDFPYTLDIPLLKANSEETVSLNAVFNNRILDIDEDTGVQVELAVNFASNNQADAIRITKPMTIYGKNAIVWKDLNMVGAFVTPKDDLLRDFVRQSLNKNRPDINAVNSNLLSAMTLFDVLGAHGINYIVDPNGPYSELTESSVDYVQFARETLKLKSGDCDDLSVLLSSGLENLGIKTAILDVPGHLLMMFDTGLAENERHMLSLDDDLLVLHQGQVWIPVEATMIGQTFAEAWAEGARKYHKFKQDNELTTVMLNDAWARFKPVTLKPAAYTVSIPEKQRVEPVVSRETGILLEKSLDRLVNPYRALLLMDEDNIQARLQIAIIYARYGLYEAANREFDTILLYDSENSAVYNNRGNIYFAQKDYERAIENYSYAERLSTNDAGIKMNISMANYLLGNLQMASSKYEEASLIDNDVGEKYTAYIKLLSK